ncbi:hypothetical protein ACF0H5_019258 [Mactra antiquata]
MLYKGLTEHVLNTSGCTFKNYSLPYFISLKLNIYKRRNTTNVHTKIRNKIMDVDTVIRNGHVIDPANQTDGIFDVAIKDGEIVTVGSNLQVNATSSYDATGYIVTPGLIDAHVHCYQYATPLGINPDETCLARGVTTIIDAGSAGATTFMGLRKFIVEKSKTRVRCLLHIALHGLAASGCSSGVDGGESDTLAVLDEEQCAQCIEENRDVIVGVKVRLSYTICDKGKTENEAFRRAISVSQKTKTPLMVHHTISYVPTQKSLVPNADVGCPIDMNPGDIYTHTYHGYMSTIVDNESKSIYTDVFKARSRGVLFDVGHGAGGFNWTVAEIATKEGFWPDMIG